MGGGLKVCVDSLHVWTGSSHQELSYLFGFLTTWHNKIFFSDERPDATNDSNFPGVNDVYYVYL